MGDHIITLTAAAEARLDLIVAASNAANKTALTLDEWLALHVKELAAQRELALAAEGIKQQAETDAETALKAERTRLLATF